MRRAARPGRRRAPPTLEVELTIDRLGAEGDGIADRASGPVYVDGALPGERVRAGVSGDRGHVRELLSTSPSRIAPPCPHYDACGGCTLQHLDPDSYAHFKRDQVAIALARRGLRDVRVSPLIESGPGQRRRVSFAVERAGKRIDIGYHPRRSHTLTAISECALISTELSRLLETLPPLLRAVLPEGRGTLTATLLETGIDLMIGAEGALDLEAREILATAAQEHGFTGLWWRNGKDDPDPVFVEPEAGIRIGDAMLRPAPGGFLQATVNGQHALQERVMAALSEAGAGPVADLYSGLGTFTLPILATGRHVTAAEADTEALNRLTTTARRRDWGPRLKVKRRNLSRDPLEPAELDGFALVVLDPPRAGAVAQVAALAEARVPLIAHASCNPATFARDAATLVEAGYRLEEVTPIDQFHWSGHVEMFGLFRRTDPH